MAVVLLPTPEDCGHPGFNEPGSSLASRTGFDRVPCSAGLPVEHAGSTDRGDRHEVQMTVGTGRS